MLNSVEVNAFLRIPYLKVGLDGSAVHVFCGPNEAGKSSLGEAIRFAIRGLSPRVKKKGAFHELICSGKKSGSVTIDLAGFPIHRNVKDGKATTRATLDYPDLLVDIQLGAIAFAEAPTEDKKDEMGLRSMLNRVFNVGTQDEFIRSRLAARGVTDDMMNRTLPLIRVSGFEAAAEQAKQEQSRHRGEWEGITHETYGHVKAIDWQPESLSKPAPSDDTIPNARLEVDDLQDKRDRLNRRLGGLSETLRLKNGAPDKPIAELETAVRETEDNHTANESALKTAQEEYAVTVDELQDQIRTLESQLQSARQATATLECPCCGAKLNIKSKENTPLLVKAEVTADAGVNIRSLTDALTQARGALTSAQSDQREIVEQLQRSMTHSALAVAKAKAALDSIHAAAAVPPASEADVEEIAAKIADLDQKLAAARAKLQDTEEILLARGRAVADRDRAAEAHRLTAQWAILTEALGSGSDGIPAELVAATTKPFNAALAKLALPLDTVPMVMSNDLSVTRADGTPWYLLSKAAQFKANAMMQLALATVSDLKLVVLDGFDVIEPDSRSLFIDMLTDFAEQHPDIRVIALGTLKKKPAESIPGVRFHWIEKGQLKEAA